MVLEILNKNILYFQFPSKSNSIQTSLDTISHNVPVVYDVFAVAIKERGAFQQPQKCAGVSRGRRSQRRRTEAEGL
jgi:hypothetical protein